MSGAEVCAGAAAWVSSSLEIRTRICVNGVSLVPFPFFSPSTILKSFSFPGLFLFAFPSPHGAQGDIPRGPAHLWGLLLCAVRGAETRGTLAALFSGPWRGGGGCSANWSEFAPQSPQVNCPRQGSGPRLERFTFAEAETQLWVPSPRCEVLTSARRWAPLRPRWEAKNLRDPVGARVNVCVSEATRERERENTVRAVSTTLTAVGERRSRDFGFPSWLRAV